MSMNYQKIADYIFVTNLIPQNICSEIVDDIEQNSKWTPHMWYNPNTKSSSSEETLELDTAKCDDKNKNILVPFIIEAGRQYNEKFSYKDTIRTMQIMNKFCPIRFNRYQKDQIMRKHHDHIHSIFDGEEKGIPVLSFIGNLNENYVGGQLVFFDGEVELNLKTGDICMFPSCFMYPHQVYEVTEGKRYSFVTWAY